MESTSPAGLRVLVERVVRSSLVGALSNDLAGVHNGDLGGNSATSAKSWLTKIMAKPSFFCRSFRSLMTCF
jgi:hypothetical protein